MSSQYTWSSEEYADNWNNSVEILFRAKSLEESTKGQWVYGFYREFRTEKGINYFIDANDHNESFFINPKTVCRYTGLTDKNGTKIFEGDIILSNFKTPFIVEWDSEGCRFLGFQPNDNSRHFSTNDKYICYLNDAQEVIGNIFDNPELFERKDY